MGPLFAFIFWFLVAVIIVVIFVSLKEKKARTGFAVIVGAGVLVVVFLIALQFFLHSNPEYVFTDALGIDPPPGVSSIQGEISSFFDSSETWLSFKASKDAILQIVASKWLIEVDKEEASRNSLIGTEGAPSFWQPFVSASAKFYITAKEEKQELLIYDETQGNVFYHSLHID